VEGPTLEQVYPEGLGSTHTGAGEKCEEEGAAELSCNGLTTAFIPPFPVALMGKERSWV